MRRDALPGGARRAPLPVSLLSRYMQPSCQPGAGIGKAVPPPPRAAPRTPSPRPKARPRSTTGAGTRLEALGGDNGPVVVARCTRAPRGSPVIR